MAYQQGEFRAVAQPRLLTELPGDRAEVADPYICSRSKQGGFVLARHTRQDQKMAKLLEIKEDLQRRWHQDKASG